MFTLKRKVKLYKRVAITMAAIIFLEVLLPVPAAYALTGGPSQPEVQGFAPVGTSEMVNTFSGDFNYNIPLMDVGGYPININYNAAPSTDQEASWVGLGWNINPGVINRNMRSLPDDFNGDAIYKQKNMKPNLTYGVNVGGGIEIYGLDFLRISMGLDFNYNNYTGIGFGVSIEPTFSASAGNTGSMSAGIGLNASSTSGVDVTPHLGLSSKMKTSSSSETSLGASVGVSVNSRAGLKALTIGVSLSHTRTDENSGSSSNSVSRSASYSFASPTYVPASEFPMTSEAGSFRATIGGEIWGLHPDAYTGGYYSKEELATNTMTYNGYGYLYSHNYGKAAAENVLHDFNREKDAAFNPKYSTNLAVTNYSYDVYSVSGQGIGGTYRPYRNDIGVMADPYTHTLGNSSSSLGAEVGMGNTAHVGVDINVATTFNDAGKWYPESGVAGVLNFKGPDANMPEYEPVYFKQAGEVNPSNSTDFFNRMGGFEARRFELIDASVFIPTRTILGVKGAPATLNNTTTYKKERQARNQNISFLTAKEAQLFGLEKQISDYPINQHTFDASKRAYAPKPIAVDRMTMSNNRPDHISEVSVLRPDGARYFYGIPAYNTLQKECTFAVEGQPVNCADGLVAYNAGNDNTANNDQGLDHYFDSNRLPAYAHSYMLTAIVSADYVDLKGDGITEDDFGSYTKINYSRFAGYKWRTPFSKASHNEGFKSIGMNSEVSDDKGSYVYGEKELWYIHSIESRTHVAEFILEDRLDGQGVKDENGGLDPSGGVQMQKLKQIKLYVKNDKMRNGANASPIKVVNFEYDYSLCTGIENHKNNTDAAKRYGKLTLKKIYFTYGNSFKGKLNAYKFNYDYENANFNYSMKAYDRWGNYKPNAATSCDAKSSPLSSAEYPYVDQDKAKADLYARAWTMTEIELPSGGKISVDYESDDYAFVQNKRAMQMFKITGTGASTSENPDNNNPLMDGNASKAYLYFKLSEPITIPSSLTGQAAIDAARKLVIRDYLKGVENVGFRFMMNLQKPNNGDAYEFVPGYLQIANVSGVLQAGAVSYSGTNPPNTFTHGYIKVKETGVQLDGGGEAVHPVCVAAWQFARLYLPRVAFSQGDLSESFGLQALNALVATWKGLKQFTAGFNRTMRNEGYAKTFVKDKSWIRLNNPNGKKLGGGHRVKRIVLNDQWSTMNNNRANYQNSTYGQEYTYTTTETLSDGVTRTISSGVASYEPLIGGEENPFRQPVFQQQSLVLAPSNTYYLEEPFGESFFPSPSIGYSKVTVKNLQFDNVKVNATGSVVHEFYTAKDYPTITKRTNMDMRRKKTNDLLKLFSIRCFDYVSASQGYVVELNDMHGKEKANWVYQEGKDVPISGVEYKYKTSEESIPYTVNNKNTTLSVPKLNNEVNVITKYPDASNSFITTKTIGVDVDVTTDMRSYNNSTTSGGGKLNVEFFFVAIIPIAAPIGFPSYAEEETSFNSIVMTKVINRFGLLEKTIAHDAGAQVATENILWDAETGEVLLTKTTNQFDDPVYNFTYPAHWAYDRMGPSYKNLGMSVNINTPLASFPNADKYFALGDEVIVKEGNSANYNNKLFIVTSVGPTGLSLMDRFGNSPSTTVSSFKTKIIRSGRRNMQSLPVGSVTSLANPMLDVNKDGKFDQLNFAQVLNSGAVEYKNFWKIFCDCAFSDLGTDDNANNYKNDYLKGVKGIWRPNTNWVYLTPRNQSVANNNTDIRKDGTYASFKPFWIPPTSATGDWTAPNKTSWQFATTLTEYSPYGYEVESQDALDRYSSAVYGYNNTLAISMGNNAQYKELAYDGFEDYGFGECKFDHFSYREADVSAYTISPAKSHTGRFSIQVVPSKTATAKRNLVKK